MTVKKEKSGVKAEKFALALSGGGSRAMAFHLGCLRALHQAGILQNIKVISSVSGGSVLAALYCHHDGDFDSFETRVRDLLAKGFLRPSLRILLTTAEGMKALVCFILLALDRLAAQIVRLIFCAIVPIPASKVTWFRKSFIRRWASRTTILQRVFSELFHSDVLQDLRADRPKLIVVACELQDKSAFYFSADGVGSWRLGKSNSNNIEIAYAAAASAAYPGLLPALDGLLSFVKDGETKTCRTVLTDGGVYDNLALSPLWPDRNPKISLHVDEYDRLIVCRAGYGLKQGHPSAFWPSRMLAVVDCALSRAENLSVNRLFDLQRSGRIKEVLLPYLGQADRSLACAPSDLVKASDVADYPTNFASMSENWIDLLSRRGEQLTNALIAEHWSDIS